MTGCKAACACAATEKSVNFKCVTDNKQTSTHDMKPTTVSIACGGCKTSTFWEDLNTFVELSHKIMSYAKEHAQKIETDDETEEEEETDTTFDSECDCEETYKYQSENSSSKAYEQNFFEDAVCDFNCGNDFEADGQSCSGISTPIPNYSKRDRSDLYNVSCGGACCRCPVDVSNFRSVSCSPQFRQNISPRSPTGQSSGADTWGSAALYSSFAMNNVLNNAEDPNSFEWLDAADVLAESMDPLYVNVDLDIVPNPPEEPSEWRHYQSSYPPPRPPARPICGDAEFSHDDICGFRSVVGSRSPSRLNRSTFSTCRSPLWNTRTASTRSSPIQTTPVKEQNGHLFGIRRYTV